MRRPSLAIVPALLWLACAQRAGSKAAEGAMQQIGEQARAAANPGERPMETAAGAAMDGAIRHLAMQLATLERVAAATSGEAADEIRERTVAGLVHDLDAGELGRVLTTLAAQTAASATDGALKRLLAECAPSDPRCLDRRIEELSGRAGAGFVRGAAQQLGLVALLLSFLGGVLAALLVGFVRRAVRAISVPENRDVAAEHGG
jgi:hypothetical protein